MKALYESASVLGKGEGLSNEYARSNQNHAGPPLMLTISFLGKIQNRRNITLVIMELKAMQKGKKKPK